MTKNGSSLPLPSGEARDFRCFTDAGFQLIFDPGAVSELAGQKDSTWFDSLEGEVKKGHLAARAFGDGAALFRVFLEGEVVPRSMEKRAGTPVQGLLEVPTGKLHFAPLEELAKPSGEPLELAPGRYEITLREMQWWELVEAIADRAGRRASPSGAKAGDVLGPLVGCFFFLTGIGGLAALIAVLNDGWDAWNAAWPWLLGSAGLFAVVAVIFRMWPGAKEALAAQQQTADRFPTTIVQLRKLPDGEGPTSGCMLSDHD